MKFRYALIFFLIMGPACKPKVQPRTALQNKLVETMGAFLHKTLKPGTTFRINEVSFYEDTTENIYMCQFRVHMHYLKKDTSGMMVATISKDFSKVIRSQ